MNPKTPNRQTDQRAVNLARAVHQMAGAQRTILFGSRARGDHRPNSDVDILIIKEAQPPEPWLESLRHKARAEQRKRLPEASGIDVICMTPQEFRQRRALRNNLANRIAKHGAQVMPPDSTPYPAPFPPESTDWQDIAGKLKDASEAAHGLTAIANAGILDAIPDKQIGRMAQNALENAYKAVLAAHGHEYPTTGRDGHNLTILTSLIKQNINYPPNTPVPGENHRYLTEFGGAALYSHEHPPLNKAAIAQDIPQAIAQLQSLAAQANPPT